ncbi:MAG TPA: GNAT family N-acetyltransferase [Candidatus Limnocylindrales bacterium]|nr:GNAT family N-acetyltransferase [Candidatus Limnocylindrales bacterium]
MTGPEAAIRQATFADIPSIRAILASHGNDGPIVYGDVVGPYLRHLIDTGRTVVSVGADEIVGFAAAVDTGRGWHLADLFVRLDRLGQGIGRPLLETVFDEAIERSTFASDDPRALPLYVRAGMTPLWPSLYVEGPGAKLGPTGAGLPTEPAIAARLAEIELDWTGQDRRPDHAFWSTQLEADPFVVLDAGQPVAIGHARARQASAVRVLERLVVHPDAEPVAVTLAAMRRAARDGPVFVCIQGPSPVLRSLLELGFRIADRDTYLASREDLIDPARLIPNPGMR